ncbi:4-hydroxy-3-methylbut-2-enyl diphosphate reductase [Geothermobacter ehrlichii]|uniref:4-hydroxy-3-methylbut-2-enyl diphosphate reductase n=1 Tax=Geothermobacter ehrlichii TaxID=213224 RepID=A0A5D3WQ24_9BACT|nr:4-hydroxy-3-methylbut-2-enyl diphosphate reductase [Geothermobacter ehrlichii]TYO99570.1 4-hydroxy-3-methylbut-2-enyl diphosphate reductase [Geothermobacter ehrlichii]
MPEILLAKSAGYCFGVKRATQMAFEAADEHEDICSLGPIIHSPQLVKRLEGQGVRVVDAVGAVENEAVIIRSHGITAGELDELKKKQVTIVDATCPFVKKAQEHAARLNGEGYHLVLVGEEEHPEVQGIISYAEKDRVHVVANVEQAEALPRFSRLAVIAQTTQAFDNFRDIIAVCLTKARELRVYNTICDATSVRQKEARDIASRVELMLVVGGYNSANTTRLAAICREIQPRTHHVETADDLDPAWFAGVVRVGVTAGASTPDWLIEQVLERIEEVGEK